MDMAFEQKIRERAYEIWLAAGMDGDAHEHWCAAETDVKAVNETVAPKTKRVAAKAKTTKASAAKTAAKTKAPAKPRKASAKKPAVTLN